MKKVSLISPCYNGESHLGYFLESLLAQSYENVEFIFVNDGSTDKTEEIFKAYQERLQNKGWDVVYISQENKGQAAAVNAGLKLVKGDYLLWPDSDDILYPEHIARKVAFMEKNPQYGVGFCSIDKVNENDLEKVLGVLKRKPHKEDNLFEDLLYNNNILWVPIGAIIRMSAFLEVNPQRDIYEGRSGQNFQMLLPISAKYKAGYMSDSLGKYVIRKASDSKNKKGKMLLRYHNLLNIWINTINSLECIDSEIKANSLAKAVAYFEFIRPCVKKIKVLGVPFFTVNTSAHKKKIMLFGLINLFTLIKKGKKVKCRLFGLFPIVSIEE